MNVAELQEIVKDRKLRKRDDSYVLKHKNGVLNIAACFVLFMAKQQLFRFLTALLNHVVFVYSHVV